MKNIYFILYIFQQLENKNKTKNAWAQKPVIVLSGVGVVWLQRPLLNDKIKKSIVMVWWWTERGANCWLCGRQTGDGGANGGQRGEGGEALGDRTCSRLCKPLTLPSDPPTPTHTHTKRKSPLFLSSLKWYIADLTFNDFQDIEVRTFAFWRYLAVLLWTDP